MDRLQVIEQRGRCFDGIGPGLAILVLQALLEPLEQRPLAAAEETLQVDSPGTASHPQVQAVEP